MAEQLFYDLFRDASETSNELAKALLECIDKFKEDHADTSAQEVSDAVKMVELKTGHER